MSKKQKITVIVLGDPESGKSAIVQTISNTLMAEGFEVAVKGSVAVRDPERLATAMKNIKDSSMIEIRENMATPVPDVRHQPPPQELFTGLANIDCLTKGQ